MIMPPCSPSEPPPRAISVKALCQMLSIGKTTAFDLIARRSVRTILIGRRRLILMDSVEDFLEASEMDTGITSTDIASIEEFLAKRRNNANITSADIISIEEFLAERRNNATDESE